MVDLTTSEGIESAIESALYEPDLEKDACSFLSHKALQEWWGDWASGAGVGKLFASLNQFLAGETRDVFFDTFSKIENENWSIDGILKLADKHKNPNHKYTYIGWTGSRLIEREYNNSTLYSLYILDYGATLIVTFNGLIMFHVRGMELNQGERLTRMCIANERFERDIGKDQSEIFKECDEKLLGDIRRDVSIKQNDILSYQKNIKNLEAGLRKDTSLLKSFEERSEKGIFKSEVENINKFDIVRNAITVGGRILIYTNLMTLRVTDPDFADGGYAEAESLLGEMLITINIKNMVERAGLHDIIHVSNLTNRDNPFAHPHIRNSACFSAWEDRLGASRDNMNLIDIVDTILGFLSTFNPEDEWGREGISYFNSSGDFDGIGRQNDTDEAAIHPETGEYTNYDNGYNGYFDENDEWVWYIVGENGEWVEDAFVLYRTGENGEINAHGDWVWYDECENGEFTEEGTWRFYEEHENGEWRENEGFVFFEDAENIGLGEYTSGGIFFFYEDDDRYEINDNAEWVLIENTQTESAIA